MEQNTHAEPLGEQGTVDADVPAQPEFIQIRLLDKIETIQNKQIDT